jgi:UDP:flavonoid glycosyltransferase YjiC (YdhE family)
MEWMGALSRILIFAEAVTLAHVGRPIALSRILRELGHEVCMAAAPAADRWLAGENVARQRIESIDSQRFLRALARGTPAYDSGTLARYVEDDLRAIAAWPPDIVIGDFRLSLYISARLARKPYGAIANAYWSRRYWTGVDAPSIAALNWLPSSVANAVFRGVYPAAFALHALPFHRACKAFGIKPPGLDIRDVYTASDVTAYADVETFYESVPGNTDGPLFIGPLAWTPSGSDLLPEFSEGHPIVFVSVGSSGANPLLTRALRALAEMPVRCVVATGARPKRDAVLPPNCIFSNDFIPYAPACAASAFVVCNGGAPATYAALLQGKPILAMTSNLDQILNMRTVQHHGGGLSVSARARSTALTETITALLGEKRFGVCASELQGKIHRPDEKIAITDWICRLLRLSLVGDGCGG